MGEYTRQKKEVEHAMKKRKREMDGFLIYMQTPPSKQLNDRIAACDKVLETIELQHRSKEDQIRDLEAKVTSLKAELAGFPKQKDLQRVLDGLNAKVNDLRVDKSGLEHNVTSLQDEILKLRSEVRVREKAAAAAAAEDSVNLKNLRQRNDDAYRGVLWLRKNRDRFIKRVFEPVMLELKV